MVALLSKLDVDKHIDVEIKLDELDLTSVESKATYAQIKEYILEKFNLKVSTLYIAQIKRKCGIELREHYNKSKSLGKNNLLRCKNNGIYFLQSKNTKKRRSNTTTKWLRIKNIKNL